MARSSTLERRATLPPTSASREAPFRQVRDAGGDGEPNDGLTLDGYGAVFNRLTVINSWEGLFREQIAPGSMKKSFRESPPKVQFDHGRHPMIGSIPIAALRSISEDVDPELAPDGGAHIIARVFDNWLMAPVRDAIEAQAIAGMSFRFEVVREAWETADGKPIRDDNQLMQILDEAWFGNWADDELPIRTLKELRVPEMGPVVWPAYDDTSVGVRSKAKVIDLGRLGDPEQQKLLARAVFIADHAAAKGNARAAADGPADDADDDPTALIGGIDATLDQASALIADVDLSTLPEPVAQACALLVAAETQVDALMDLMGIYDPDDDDDQAGDSADGDSGRSQDVDGTKPSQIDAPRSTGTPPADEHPSSSDAPRSTATPAAGEHPSKSTAGHRLTRSERNQVMAETRAVLLSIDKGRK
jgi:phage head maturation protease